MSDLKFTVIGHPEPQGSTKAFVPKGWTRAIVTSANKKNKPWRQEVAGVAKVEMQRAGIAMLESVHPVRVHAEFYFARPKSTKKSVIAKVTRPDVDKTLRSILDALTGIVFEDDAQVIDIHGLKLFGTPERVELTIGPASVPMPLFVAEPAEEVEEVF
jgi:Holliday junction resolvase RusA-like endonuclease